MGVFKKNYCKMVFNYDDYVLLNESVLNEGFSFSDIKNIISNIKNKDNAISHLINKYNSADNKKVKRNIALLLSALFIFTAFKFMSPDINSESDRMANKITKSNTISITDIKNAFNEIIDDNKTLDVSNDVSDKTDKKSDDYKDPLSLKVSQETRDFIKNHEKLRLTAYSIGDGRITIGYGHSEPESNSKYKLGDRISKEDAEKLFRDDLQYAADGVRRMFKQWKDDGFDIRVTQSMFDAMVSMAYNMGVTKFRNSKFVKHLKEGDYDTASIAIKSTAVNSKFPGLKDRRSEEYQIFVKDTNKNNEV